MIKKEKFKVTKNLNMQTSFGIIPGSKQNGVLLDVSLEVDPSKQYGWFEFYDEETGGDRWYASGGIWFIGTAVTDYDGIFELPEFIMDKLEDWGYDLSTL
jgi:hypothetical protein